MREMVRSEYARFMVPALLLLSVIGNVVFMVKSGASKRDMEKTILRSDSLLSVSLLADKKFDNVSTALKVCRQVGDDQREKLTRMDRELAARNALVNELKRDNAKVKNLGWQVRNAQKLNRDCEKLVNEFIAENNELEGQLRVLRENNQALQKDIEDLKAKVALGKILQVVDIRVAGYSARKPTLKARKTSRLSVQYTIAANPLADPGNRDVHIVLYDEKGLLKKNAGSFLNKTEQRQQAFHAFKSVSYNSNGSKENSPVEVSGLKKGKYKVEVYVDGVLSGKDTFTLL